jgi:cell division protein ZapA
MTQVSVTLNGRSYRLRCGDGEESRLVELASHVKAKVDKLLAEHGNVGDDRLILMAALMVADELWDARAAVSGAEIALRDADDALRQALERAQSAEEKLAAARPAKHKGVA